MKELLGLFPEEIKAELTAMGEKAFRAGQVFSWLNKGKTFDEMTNLSLAFREKLKANFVDQPVSIQEIHTSKLDGTRKFLFALRDGNCVEGVLMKYKHGYSLCISTQVGCNMGCAFCASTLEGKVRDLTAAEMLGQVHAANSVIEDGEHVHNIVMMGAGEPLDNYDNAIRFIKLVSHADGLNIGVRHISLSTCGLISKIDQLAEEDLPVTLSLSLHAPNDQIRRELMPIARRYTIEETINACRRYVEKTGRRVIFEYALIKNVNSSIQHARELSSRLHGFQCHVNLIPLNSVKERNLLGVTEKEVKAFLDELTANNISATRRREMGDDIDGACGQLRRKYLQEVKE